MKKKIIASIVPKKLLEKEYMKKEMLLIDFQSASCTDTSITHAATTRRFLNNSVRR